MALNEEQLKGILSIYKFAYKNPAVHRNIMRKELLHKGKISSKEKFSRWLESLLSLGTLTMEKELVSINPEILQVGVLKKERDYAYIVTPNSKKHIKVDKNAVAGYSSGDILDLLVSGSDTGVVVLGRKQKKKEVENTISENGKIKPQVRPVAFSEHSSEIFPNGGQAEVAARDENLLLGRVVKVSHDNLIFIPNKKSLPKRQIPILNGKEELAAFQDKICVMRVENIETPLTGGYIVSVKGDAGNPIHEYDAIAENYGAVMSWADAKDEIAKIPTEVDTSSLSLISEEEAIKNGQRGKTVDLRHLPFVTVDPATCRDMDDAIYSTLDESGNIVCYAAVANVTKYVDLESVIGQKYMSGSFTIYAPNRAYSILPPEYSTGICSLNPNEDRLSFVVKTVLDQKTGEVLSRNIFDAVIQSRQKYKYEDPQEMIDTIDPEEARGYIFDKIKYGEPLSLEEQCFMNYYAAQAIWTDFENRRMIRFNSNKEREIVFDEGMQDVVAIKPVPHLKYHEVIEAFMITANESTAKFAKDHRLDNVYRIHEKPNPRKLGRADEFFDILGYDFDGDLSAESTRALIEIFKGDAREEEINSFLIKMQSRAKYSSTPFSEQQEKERATLLEYEELISHFALQSKHYSHTTSPIRRAVDYATQYNILAHMHGTKPLPKSVVQKIIEIANERQLEIDQAEKDFQDISSVLYCEKHIGEKLSGQVSKVRYTSSEEEYDDEIVVIAKDKERGISAEIPLSQIIGRRADNCRISEQGCAVYDERGNLLVRMCEPIDFIIDKASRKTMIVTGRTTKSMVYEARTRGEESKAYRGHRGHQHGANHHKEFANHKKQKQDRSRRIESNHNYKNEAEWGAE